MIHPPPYTTLTDDAISIRPYRLSDVDGQLAAALESHHEVYPWLPWCASAYTQDDARGWVSSRDEAWKQGSEYSFVITNANGVFLGSVGLNTIDFENQRANLGYWVRTSATRKGIASTASVLIARFGIETVGLKRIEIVAAVDNIASQRVAEKAGATREGILRNRLFLHGKSVDCLSYSITP